MKRVLLAIGIVLFFSSSAFAENFEIESVCASVKSGESKYDLQPQGSISFLAAIGGINLTERPAFTLKFTALAVQKAQNDEGCPEMNKALFYKLILNKDFSDTMVPTVKKVADGHIRAITKLYNSVKKKYYICEKVSGFISMPNTRILACDKNTNYYYSSVGSNFQIKFCGNSLNDNCFR